MVFFCLFQNAVLYVGISVLFLMSSSLIIHQVYAYQDSFSWVPKATRHQLFATAVHMRFTYNSSYIFLAILKYLMSCSLIVAVNSFGDNCLMPLFTPVYSHNFTFINPGIHVFCPTILI